MKKIIILLTGLFAIFSFANGQLFLQPGAMIHSTGEALITLKSIDLENNGSIVQNAGEGTFLFTGDTYQTIKGTGTTQIDHLKLDMNGTAIKLEQDLSIAEDINLVNGKIELNQKKITLMPGALLLGENHLKHITGIDGGAVVTSASSVSNPSNLDMGNLGAEITSGADLGYVIISRSHKPFENPANPALTGIHRTFLITPTNDNNLDATLKFKYFSHELNGKDPAQLKLWTSTDGVNWSFVGADLVDEINHFVQKSGINHMSYWTLSDPSAPLPLVLKSFSASCQNNYARVQWQTASESGIASFLLQKSEDGLDWNDIQTVDARNFSNGSSYAFNDMDPAAKSFYRLKILSQNGAVSYSNIFSGGCNDIAMPLTVYPNPAQNFATARFGVRTAGDAMISIYSEKGQLLQSNNWQLNIGMNSYPLNNLNVLASGVYLIKVIFNGNEQFAKLIKN